MPENPAGQEHNPLIDKSNEFGFINSFVPSPDDGAAQLLQRMLISGSAGGLAGRLDSRQPNAAATSIGTGLGGGIGHLAGKLTSDALDVNPDTAAAAQLLASLLGAGVGYHMSSKIPKEQKLRARIPGFHIKQADFTTKLDELSKTIHHHLPSIRGLDSLVGTATGAGAGYLVNKLRDNSGLTDKERASRRNRAMLIGGGLGSLGGNLIGDRFRRYVSNTIDPAEYGVQSLRPRSWKHFVDAAIKDRPAQPYISGDPDWTAEGFTPIKGRRELLRIAEGVHTPNSKTDYWSKNTNGSVSINPNNEEAGKMLKDLLVSKESDPALLKDPMQYIGRINSDHHFNQDKSHFNGSELMTNIVGGQRINVQPFYQKFDPAPGAPPSDIVASINDRWGVWQKPEESKYFKSIPKEILQHGLGWLNQPVDTSRVGYTEGTNMTNADAAKSLGSRWLAENVLFKNAPWVSQHVHFKHNPTLQQYDPTPYTGDGRPYNAY
ncbi:MAG: hypothetical protein EBU46_11885 [Nitrosomonadaceae bacterium]|nr:hypothetical protein [Nitrosomonadaceae bacterium]